MLPVLGHPMTRLLPFLEPTRDDKTLPKFSNYADLWALAALSEIVVDCAVTSGLGAIGEPIIEISQAHNYRGGIIVFQFFRRHAHLCALAKMN